MKIYHVLYSFNEEEKMLVIRARNAQEAYARALIKLPRESKIIEVVDE